MQYKGIIFDLDGVLVFTDRYHFQAWKLLADELGIYFDEKINERLRGVSRMESLEIILERWQGSPFSQEPRLEMAERKNYAYRKLLAGMTPGDVTGEVRGALAQLRAQGVRLAIGSSSKNADYILARTELTDCFDAVADGNDITHSKPDPEVFLLAAQRLALSPLDCLVVEDALAGIQAAKAGGFGAAGIGSAADCPQIDHRLLSLSELAALVTK